MLLTSNDEVFDSTSDEDEEVVYLDGSDLDELVDSGEWEEKRPSAPLGRTRARKK